jgi:putative copper resistance protein D
VSVEIALDIVRALHDGSAIALFGSYLFLVSVARPALARVGAPADELPAYTHFVHGQARIALALLLLSGAAWLWLVAADLDGAGLGPALADGTVAKVLTGTWFGQVWLGRAVLGLMLAALLWPAPSVTPGLRLGAREGAILTLSALLLGSIALVGHAAAETGKGPPWHLAADLVHLWAAGAWLGALPPLGFAFARIGWNGGLKIARAIAKGFARLGIASVTALIAAGLVNAWYMVGGWEPLVSTPYGRLLLLKIAFFLAMLACAARNYLTHTPRLSTASAAPSLVALRRNTYLEIALGVAVLLAVGVLVGSAPALPH